MTINSKNTFSDALDRFVVIKINKEFCNYELIMPAWCFWGLKRSTELKQEYNRLAMCIVVYACMTLLLNKPTFTSEETSAHSHCVRYTCWESQLYRNQARFSSILYEKDWLSTYLGLFYRGARITSEVKSVSRTFTRGNRKVDKLSPTSTIVAAQQTPTSTDKYPQRSVQKTCNEKNRSYYFYLTYVSLVGKGLLLSRIMDLHNYAANGWNSLIKPNKQLGTASTTVSLGNPCSWFYRDVLNTGLVAENCIKAHTSQDSRFVSKTICILTTA